MYNTVYYDNYIASQHLQNRTIILLSRNGRENSVLAGS